MTNAVQQALRQIDRATRITMAAVAEDMRQEVRREARQYLPYKKWWLLMDHQPLPMDRQVRIALLRRAKEAERRRAGHFDHSPARLIALRGAYLAERLAAFRDRAQAKEAI